MSDGIPQSRAAAGSQSKERRERTGTVVPRRQGFIQCRQCMQEFARRTMVCPRCNRLNDRSPLMLSFKLVVAVLFVCIVVWVIRVVGKTASTPPVDEVEVLPTPANTPAGRPDVGF